VVTGGHALAQAPEQLDFPLVSATHRYSARPDVPVRYVPSALFAVPIETPVAGAAALDDADEVAAGALEAAELAAVLELELLPHAATASATPTHAATLPARIFRFFRTTIILLPPRGFR
jgi:hypothetical protein